MQYKIQNRKYHLYYFASAIIGASSIVWSVMIYRITLISIIIPMLILITVGTIAFFIDKPRYQSTYKTNWPNTFSWLQNILSWGFIGCTLFLATNKHLANSKIKNAEYRIDNVSTMPLKPYINW